jgi:predicted RNase H-like HicB family nuclease
MEPTKTLEDYKRLPYTLRTEPAEDGGYWIAEYVELRGCKTDGETEAGAVANLHELFDDFIQTLIDEKVEIPEPRRLFVPISPIWVEVRQRSSQESNDEDVSETETSWETTRFQVGNKENLAAYL